MKLFPAAALILTSLLPCLHAQEEADERYLAIYGEVQQADGLSDAGQPRKALGMYNDAQGKLDQFRRLFPDWNTNIINFRLDYLADKITELKERFPVVTNQVATVANDLSAELQSQLDTLQSQLQSAQLENESLQAKLREALATQPAAIDAGELSRAQSQIVALMKQNDLLKVTRPAPERIVVADTNAIAQAQQEIAEYSRKLAVEQAQADQLAAANQSLQQRLVRTNAPDASALVSLRDQNEKLRQQLASLQTAAASAPDAAKLAAQLKTTQDRLAAEQSQTDLALLEKQALEVRVRQLLALTNAASRAANYEARIRDLTQERNDLMAKLADAQKTNTAHKGGDVTSQLAALNDEVNVLRSRLAVDEAQVIPYSTEELALFKQPSPVAVQTVTEQKPIREMPTGTAELVASAERHFANHEFDEAETDYRKILDRDQNNALALGNMATIELQQNKLMDAEQHLKLALAAAPNDAYNLSTYGYLKFRQEKYDEALDALSRAARLDTQNPEIQNYLGVALSHKGLRVQAETALRKAVQIDPNYAPAHNNLAVIYISQHPPLPELARWHYQKALDAGQPRNADLEKMLSDQGAPVSPP